MKNSTMQTMNIACKSSRDPGSLIASVKALAALRHPSIKLSGMARKRSRQLACSSGKEKPEALNVAHLKDESSW
jgi:hypothetical protein